MEDRIWAIADTGAGISTYHHGTMSPNQGPIPAMMEDRIWAIADTGAGISTDYYDTVSPNQQIRQQQPQSGLRGLFLRLNLI